VRGLMAQIIDDYSRQTGQKFDSPSAPPGIARDHRVGWPAD